MSRQVLTGAVVGAVFLFQLWNGLEQGTGSGGRNEPYVVIISALMAAFLAWTALQAIFMICSKKRR